MIREVLLDTNLLIGYFDGDPNSQKHREAEEKLEKLLEDPDVRLVITPLIRYEVLRGAKNIEISELNKQLNEFEEFDINAAMALRAAELFAVAKNSSNPTLLNKRSFDLFHCVCAELNDLEINSHDGDIEKIKELINQNPRT
jgi:predicted nucleic acid-binding protein